MKYLNYKRVDKEYREVFLLQGTLKETFTDSKFFMDGSFDTT